MCSRRRIPVIRRAAAFDLKTASIMGPEVARGLLHFTVLTRELSENIEGTGSITASATRDGRVCAGEGVLFSTSRHEGPGVSSLGNFRNLDAKLCTACIQVKAGFVKFRQP